MINKNEVMKFEANGKEVALTADDVKNYLVSGNGNITDQEVMMFLQLCKYQGLNPWLNEAYIVKFGSRPAQLIVGKEAYMKRAEAQLNYEGFSAGVVVVSKQGEIIEREGTIKLKDEALIGGWAEVYQSDKRPVKVTINFDEFAKRKNDGDLQSTWASMPTHMIRKTALVNALREAFPQALGGMYTDVDDRQFQNAENEKMAVVDEKPKKSVTNKNTKTANKQSLPNMDAEPIETEYAIVDDDPEDDGELASDDEKIEFMKLYRSAGMEDKGITEYLKEVLGTTSKTMTKQQLSEATTWVEEEGQRRLLESEDKE